MDGLDTDSLTLALSGETLRDCVREDQLEVFDREKWNYLVNPDNAESRREPGKWKARLIIP